MKGLSDALRVRSEPEEFNIAHYTAGRIIGSAAYYGSTGAAFYLAASVVTLPFALTPALVAGFWIAGDFLVNASFALANRIKAINYALHNKTTVDDALIQLNGNYEMNTSGVAERMQLLDGSIPNYSDFTIGIRDGFAYSGVGKIFMGLRQLVHMGPS